MKEINDTFFVIQIRILWGKRGHLRKDAVAIFNNPFPGTRNANPLTIIFTINRKLAWTL